MKKNIGYIILSVSVGLGVLQSAYSQDRDIGFSKRFGGTEEQRNIQLSIMDNTAATAESVHALSTQMNTVAASIERMNASLQGNQKSIERQVLEVTRGSDLAKEQRDLLNLMVRYLAKQQEVNEQLLEENRKIRQALENKGMSVQ